MQFQHGKAFDNASIHLKMQKDFLSGSEPSSEVSSEFNHKNGFSIHKNNSVLQDLMESSEMSNKITKMEIADPKIPFFENHFKSGQSIILKNVKKYNLMKKLGLTKVKPIKSQKSKRIRKRIISDETWKDKKNQSKKHLNVLNKNLNRHSKLKCQKNKVLKLKKKNWTVTEFGRVEESKNLIVDIKQSMKLNSDKKVDLLRDDSKIKSFTSFCDFEDCLGYLNPKRKSPQCDDIINSSSIHENDSDVIHINGKEFICKSPVINKNIKISPPKLKKKSPFRNKFNVKDIDFDFLNINGKIWTEELEFQNNLIHTAYNENSDEINFISPLKKNKKNKISKTKNNFLNGFNDIFSNKNSVSNNRTPKIKNDSVVKKSTIHDSPSVDLILATENFQNKKTLINDDSTAIDSKIFGNDKNYSLNLSCKSEKAKLKKPLNKSSEYQKKIGTPTLKGYRLVNFFGKKMSKSKGEKPDLKIVSSPSNKQSKGNWIKNSELENKDFRESSNLLFSNKTSFKSQLKSKKKITTQSSKEKNNFCFINSSNTDKSKILNTNIITFCSESLFGGIQSSNINSQSPFDEFKNPFEDIKLDLNKSQESDWDDLLSDPTQKVKKNPNSFSQNKMDLNGSIDNDFLPPNLNF
jgi:hypothetical protein